MENSCIDTIRILYYDAHRFQHAFADDEGMLLLIFIFINDNENVLPVPLFNRVLP